MKGGFLGGLGRMFTGESLFLATYTSCGEGQQIALASSFPGSIIALRSAPAANSSARKSFLCAMPGVNLSVGMDAAASGRGWRRRFLCSA